MRLMERIAMVLALIVGLGGYAQAAGPTVLQAAQLFAINDTSDPKDGAALLWRTRNELRLTVHASDLESHTAYTLWIAVFRRPENCADSPAPGHPELRCGPMDLVAMPNPAQASAFYVGGFVTDDSGTANASGYVRSGTPPEGATILVGKDGIVVDNGVRAWLPRGKGLRVELRFALRSHGAIDTMAIAEQISTWPDGADQQMALFPPAK